jgi:MFS transporter, PAT family, beta-lactamase induction signal transducer AmpG
LDVTTPSASSGAANSPTPLNTDPKDTPLPTDRGEESERVPAQGLGDGRPTAEADALSQKSAINPWLFVPVLYFMQFLPNGVVTSLFGTVYKSLGVDNVSIATWTGLAALPWTFKMFWGPLVDLNSTKRRWTVTMQMLLTVTLLLTAGAIATPKFFVITVALMFVIATLSATHDIACDGLYLMSLDKKRQAAFSGVMAAFSRLGRLFIDSILVVIAGRMINDGMTGQRAWMLAIGIAALIYAAGAIWNFFNLPRPAADVPVANVAEGERTQNVLRTLAIIATGVVTYYFIASTLAMVADMIHARVPAGSVPANWDLNSNQLLWNWVRLGVCAVLLPILLFVIRALVRGTTMGDAFVSYARQPGFKWILSFIVFYRFGEAMIFAMAALFILDKPDVGGMGVSLEHLGFIKGVGQVLGLMLGGLLGGWWIARVGLRRAFWPLVLCMHIPNVLYIWAAYHARWIGEQNVTVRSLWITIPVATALVAIVGLTWRKSRSAKATLIVGALAAISFYFLRPTQAWTTIYAWPLYPVVFAEAFGYGAGFAGYFVYLMHVAQRGRFVTSHYAIGTGLGALFITFATILAGIVQSVFGYKGVFIAACLLTIPGTLTLLFIPMEDEETKRVKVASDH